MNVITVAIDAERCKSCGYCVAVCPRQALEIGAEINAKGYRAAAVRAAEACVGCAMCATMCPEAAIEIWR